MPEDGAKRSYRLALQITAIVLLLAVLAGILVSEHWRMASDLTLVRAEIVTVADRPRLRKKTGTARTVYHGRHCPLLHAK